MACCVPSVSKSVSGSPQSSVQAVDMITGEQMAPWENPKKARALLRPLGIFKSGVLGLIHRDPTKRSTVHKFQQACLRALSNTSITASTSHSRHPGWGDVGEGRR